MLGFSVTFQNGDPVIFTLLERDRAEIHLLLTPGHHGPAFNVAHVCVDEADALHAICIAAGAPITKAVADKDYDMRAFVPADLDGNRIDIGQPD